MLVIGVTQQVPNTKLNAPDVVYWVSIFKSSLKKENCRSRTYVIVKIVFLTVVEFSRKYCHKALKCKRSLLFLYYEILNVIVLQDKHNTEYFELNLELFSLPPCLTLEAILARVHYLLWPIGILCKLSWKPVIAESQQLFY